MGNDNTIMILIMAAVAYFVFFGKKTKAAVSSASSAACPRGPQYSRGFFEDCDPNYVFGGWINQDCVCLSSSPQPGVGVSDTIVYPQPMCPYDPMLLAGDTRCTPPENLAPGQEPGQPWDTCILNPLDPQCWSGW